jgi:hypothetical protein
MNQLKINLFKNNSLSAADYLLMFLLIEIGWFTILLNINRLELILVPIVFYFLFRRNKGNILNNKIIFIFIIYSFLALMQGMRWGFSVVSLITSFSFAFLVPYFLFRIYKGNFFFILEKVIQVLTIIAMLIWLAHQFIPGAKEIITNLIITLNKNNTVDLARSMIFYTYWPNIGHVLGLSRNAGFSGEPGGFAGFILLAIVINYRRNIKLFDKRNLLYFIALISTFSTAAYLSLFALGLLLLKQKKYKILGILLFPVFIYGAVYAYKNLEFMQPKIELQFQDQIKRSLNQPTSGRIYGARKSVVALSEYPFFGRGLLAITNADIDAPTFAAYGWLSQMARFGILFGSLFMFYFLRGFFRFLKAGGHGIYECFVYTLAIMITLSSQAFLTDPIFMVFFYLGLYNFVKVKKNYVVPANNHLNSFQNANGGTRIAQIKL